MRLTGRFHRYGYAAVSFGEPLSLSDFVAQPHDDPAKALGADLMARIAAVMPVTPVPLVSLALVEGATTREALSQAVTARIAAARDSGAAIHIPRDDEDYTVEAGLRALTERGLLSVGAEGGLTLTTEGRKIAAYYAASIAHLFNGTAAPVSHAPRRAETSAT
jgi:glycerol-3-phosphate O-acyltransferase